MGRAPGSNSSGLKKGPWTAEEDQKLKEYIDRHGAGNWRTLPENAGLQRCGKSCRLRWTNYLRPDIKRGRFSFEEEEAIIQLHSILGNKWSAIAARLPGRTDNEIKNYWNTHIRKRLLRMGLDPVTHAPRLDQFQLNNLSNMLFLLNQQQNQNHNQQMVNIVTSLLSLNHQQQEQNQHDQSFQQPYSSFPQSGMHGELNGLDFQQSTIPEATAASANPGSLSNFTHNNMQQFSSNSTTPFTSYASSPLDSSCSSYNRLSTDDEIDSVLNFEIPEGFDLSELLY